MVTALVLHSGHDVVGDNRGYPTLTVYDYWNCTGASALWCSWLPELPASLFEGGGSLTHDRNIEQEACNEGNNKGTQSKKGPAR